MSTARWRHQTADVSMESVNVHRVGTGGFDVQLGSQVLWVESLQHWKDITEKVMAAFYWLPPALQIPLPRKGMKANVAGACWGDDE